MRLPLIALTALVATPALAAEEPTPRIIVAGTASISTPPDRVAIAFSLHGEGATSDDAMRAMADKRKVLDGVTGLARAEPRSTSVNILEVRGPSCMRSNYPAQPRLSTGDCTIIGYTADQTMELRTAAVKDAGTIVGLIGRLGGTNPRIERFYLSDDNAARTRAVGAALAEARAQAEAIATASKVSLGRVLSVSDNGYMMPMMGDIVVSANAPSTPPPPPPVVSVSLNPRAIETQARVQVVFAIGQ